MNKFELVEVKLDNGDSIYIKATAIGNKERDISSKQFSLSEEEIEDTIKNTSNLVTRALSKIEADKISVEFGIELVIKSGKFTSLLVEGESKANIKVNIEWNNNNKL